MERKRIALVTFLVIAISLSVMIGPVIGAPIEGGYGSRIQANFMSQDPDPADAGKILDLRWQIVNMISGTSQNLKFHLDAEYPFLFDVGDSPDKELGASAGTNDDQVFYVLHYRLRVADNAIKGTYNVTLSWDSGNGRVKKVFPIHVDPNRADFVVGSLLTSPEKLVADTDEAKLSVDIDNIGNGNAENVKVNLILPEGFESTYSYSDEDSLGTIEEGSSKQADFYIDVDESVREGEYNASLLITYKDENDDTNQYRTKSLDLRVPVKPSPYLVVESVVSDPDQLEPGSKAVVVVKVKNTGNKKAESVSLRVFKDAAQPFEFSEKSDFVGKLEPGDSGDAAIRFTIENSAVAKKYLLDVELRGIDEKENVLIFRRTIPITVNPGTGSFPPGGLGTGLVAFIGLVAVTLYMKNGRKKIL